MMAKVAHRSDGGALGSGALPRSSAQNEIATLIATLPDLDLAALGLCWRNHLGGAVPVHLPRWLLVRVLAFRLQAATHGDLAKSTLFKLKRESADAKGDDVSSAPFAARAPATRDGADLRPGALLVREWRGKLERVTVLEQGFAWNGRAFGSLSQVAKAITGTSWNGHRFFGLRSRTASNDRAGTAKPIRRRAPRGGNLPQEPPR